MLSALSLPPSQESCIEFLSNTQQIEKQATPIKTRLESYQRSSPPPIYEARDQLSSRAQVMLTSFALMQSKIDNLREAKKALHICRKKKRKATWSDRALSISEVQALVTLMPIYRSWSKAQDAKAKEDSIKM